MAGVSLPLPCVVPPMLLAQDILARAQQCESAAERSNAELASSFREVARQWRELAAGLELLEREAIYRTIRNRRGLTD